MVTIYGNSISGGFTSGTPLVAIYTYGCQVWPVEESWTGPWPGPEVHPGDYYISWTPTSASGAFFGGSLETYSGYYELGRNHIPANGLISLETISTVETTAFTIGVGAFSDCRSLLSVNLPHCSSISRGAFFNCLNLSYVSLPECKYIGTSAFTYNMVLHSVDLPNVEFIGERAFNSCGSLTNIQLGRNCSMVASHAFDWCGNRTNNGTVQLKLSYSGEGPCAFGTQSSFAARMIIAPWYKLRDYYDFPYQTVDCRFSGYFYVSYPGYYSERSYGELYDPGIFGSAGVPSYFETDAGLVAEEGGSPTPFENNSTLVSASMPQLLTVSAKGFYSCTNLRELYTPKLQVISGQAFAGCTSLEYMDIPNCSVISNRAFSGCTSLSYILLGLSSCELGSYAFSGCSNLQSILVPSSYVEDYRSATNWSDYASLIVGYGV